MGSPLERVDGGQYWVEQLAREAVKLGLTSALREPILEGVEEMTGETLTEARGERLEEEINDGDDDRRGGTLEAVDERQETGTTVDGEVSDEMPATDEKLTLSKALQGAFVFIVMFVVLYVTLRRLTSDEST